jgi:hypothetical protein
MLIGFASLVTMLYTMSVTILALAQGRFHTFGLECSRAERPAKYWVNIVWWTLASMSLYSNFSEFISR